MCDIFINARVPYSDHVEAGHIDRRCEQRPVEAGVSVRPHMSRAGPRMPPNSTMAPSHGRAPARSGASDPETERKASRCDPCEAGTRAKIKQPGKQQRVGDAEEQLCNRGARTEQECRA